MALVRCNVSEGPRAGFKAVAVPSVEGHSEHLVVEDRFLVKRGDATYLPVMLIGRDSRYGTALVQLPLEADSGANRVWVKADQIEEPGGVAV